MTDEDLQYAIENATRLNLGEILDEILDAFVKYRILFFIVFLMEMTFNSFLMYITWQKREFTINLIENSYRGFHKKEAQLMFYIILGAMALLNLIIYPLGITAVITKKIKWLKFFSKFSLYTSVIIIFMVFINL